MKLFISILVALLVANVISTQYIPIPNTDFGITVGDQTGKLHIQAFYDLACIDSKASDLVLRDVFKTISMAQNSIKFTYNFFPLPYHFYAFKLQQGFSYILSKLGPVKAQQYVRFIFDNQADYAQEVWETFTINEFITSFALTISTKFGVNQTEFRQALRSSAQIQYPARYQWKYGTSLGMSGTPIFYANGVRIDGADNWKYAEWIQFFNKYTQTKQLSFA